MSTERAGLEWVRSAVQHRVAGHQAALAHAEVLGWPHILSDQVHATNAAQAEAAAILEIIEAELDA